MEIIEKIKKLESRIDAIKQSIDLSDKPNHLKLHLKSLKTNWHQKRLNNLYNKYSNDNL